MDSEQLKNINEKLKDINLSLEELKFIYKSNMKIDVGKKIYYIHDSNKSQEIWNNFRLSFIISKFENTIKLLSAGGHIIPKIDEINQFILQNIIIRLTIILDDHLDNEVINRKISLKKEDLYNRINELSKAGFIKNQLKLHDLRILRNSIAHDINVKNIDWEDVDNYINEVENTLVFLGIIKKAPLFTVGELSMSSLEKSNNPNEKYRRYLTFSINGDNKLYFSYKWTYIYW